jgi:hypothetical protein
MRIAADRVGSGFGGRKTASSMGKISSPGVLRLRATTAVSRDKSVRRSAQDDDFVGVWTKNIPDKLALMGCNPGVPLPLKWTIRDSGQPTQDHVLGNFQPSLRSVCHSMSR